MTGSQIILGSDENNLLDLIWNLQQNLEKDDSVRIAVAYASESGYNRIQPILKDLLRTGVYVEIVVGLGQGNTDIRALENLKNLMDEHPDGFVCRVVWGKEIDRNQFHPKLYIFTGKGKSKIVLGSSNLTRGGLTENTEANTIITNQALTAKAISFFKYIRENSITLDEDVIDSYRPYFKKAKGLRKNLTTSEETWQVDRTIAKKRSFKRFGENAMLFVVWNDRGFSGIPSQRLSRTFKGETFFAYQDPWETDYIFDAFAYADGHPNCFNRVRPGSLIFVCSSENHKTKPMKVIGYLYVKVKDRDRVFQTSDGYFKDVFPYVIEADKNKSTLFSPYVILDSKLAKQLHTFDGYSLDKPYSKGPQAGEKMPVSFRIWSAIRAVRGLTDEDVLVLLNEYLRLPGSRNRTKVKNVIDELKKRL